MFNFGFSELLVIGVIALIFIGPKQLPEVARVVGRLLNEFKRATGDLTGTFVNARNEADDFLRKTRDQLTEDLKDAVEVDVFADHHDDHEKHMDHHDDHAAITGDEHIDGHRDNYDGHKDLSEHTDPHIETLPEVTDPNISYVPENTDPHIEILPEHTDPNIDVPDLDEKTADVVIHGVKPIKKNRDG